MVSGKGQQLPDCNHQSQVKHHVIRVLVIFFPYVCLHWSLAATFSPCLFSFEVLLKFSQHLTTQKSSGSSERDVKDWSIHSLLPSSIHQSWDRVKPVLASILGGPQLPSLFPSLSPSICFRSFKQLLVYKTSFPLIPWQLNFFNSLQCGTLSEALWKFKYIMSSESPLSASSLTLL